MRGSRRFCLSGPTLTTFFSRGERTPNTTIRRSSLFKVAFRWQTDDGPTLNVGLAGNQGQYCLQQVAHKERHEFVPRGIATKPYSFVIFQGGSGTCVQPLDLRMQQNRSKEGT